MQKKRRPLSRSEQMARIRGQDTRPERLLRSALWAAGLRYRLQAPTPGGRADLVFLSSRVAILIDGCFWHGCPLHYVRPRSRTEFWESKLAGNVARDRAQTLGLEAQGWRVLRFWEHEIHENLEGAVCQVKRLLADLSAKPDGDDWRVVRVTVAHETGDRETRFLERLRSPQDRRSETGPRITSKWKTRRPG